MKGFVTYFCFFLFTLCSPLYSVGIGKSLFIQDSLKPPKVILAGKPKTIQIPKVTGGGYIQKISDGTRSIKLMKSKIFTLPIMTTLTQNDIQSEMPDQFASGQGLFTSYTTDNGLIVDGISSSYMDHFGNLWFGTGGGGVSRYDGKSFINYTTTQGFSNYTVLGIAEDMTGNLWFATDGGGVFCYNGRTFVNYTTAQGLGNNHVLSIKIDRSGILWFGTNGGGISRYDRKSFVNYTSADGLANNSVNSILEDRNGNLWFGTSGGGVSRYDREVFVNYTTVQGLANNSVNSALEDNNGNLWFGTNGGGVSCYDGKSFVNYTIKQGLANNIVKTIFNDNTGNLWFGTNGGGVSCYDGKSFVNYTTVQGLANNLVYSILEDRAGNLWFSTFGGGISRYDGKSFINFTVKQGLANNLIWSIREDKKGSLWFGSYDGGVSRYDGKSFENYSLSQGLAGNIVFSILEDKNGNLWFGTAVGVSCFDGKSFSNYTTEQGLADNVIYSILEDRKGNLWFGTGTGVSCFDGKSFRNYTTEQGLANNLVWTILEDKTGNLWFGTDGGGVSCYNGEFFVNYTTDQGLASDIVFKIIEDKAGNLWFGTQHGLSYVYANDMNFGTRKWQKENWNMNQEREKITKNPPALLFKTITTSDGLPDDFVTQVIELPNHRIAVGTNLGIAIFNPPDIKEKNLTGIELFNSSTGYPIKDVNVGQNAMYRDSKGIIWIATGSDKTGVVRFDYSSIHFNKNAPTVVIQSVKVNEENICWENLQKMDRISKEKKPTGTTLLQQNDSLSLLLAQFYTFGKRVSKSVLDGQYIRFGDIQFDSITKFYPLPQKLVLPYSHNQIGFEFAAIEPARPYLVRYQYILEGYDNDWSPITNKTNVSFGHIHEGTYTFKLKAQNPNGIWSDPITYTFRVLPPWWRTWWAYTAYVILGIFCVLLVLWWNGMQLRKRAKKLKQEVKKATATIEEQKRFVEEKNRKITDSINYAQRIQNAILPENTFIKSLCSDYFIYHQPKDIVSGDFYWFGKKNEKVIFAAVDCTGHGVPGAFMSMIGNTLLNEIINEKGIVESDEILNHLRSGIIHSLKQSDTPGSQRDGMDIALCVLDKNKNLLWFSGAHNPLYLFRNGILIEFKSDSQTIGYERGENKPYKKIKIEVQQGDVCYIFTDGFADQKGEVNKKKYYYKPFQELLSSIQYKPMPEQEEILKNSFNKWKGSREQIDDVLIIGLKL